MTIYDFNTLNDKEFERFVVDLFSSSFGQRIERFKPGKDSGVDGRFFKQSGEEVIIQCKHWSASGISRLIKYLEKSEVEKVKKLKPKKYILVTSLGLSRANKKKIKSIFDPYILCESDIYGKEDLNQILSKYPDIESRHYKLWMVNMPVFTRVLNNAIYGRSQAKLQEVKDKTKLYVYTKNHSDAMDKIIKNKTLIITGEPGSGKTTLADQLCLNFVKNEYEFFYIQEDIREAENVIDKDRKQAFYFDDFLGRNYLEAIDGHSDSAICDFINRIKLEKNKYFVLTSRTNIINKGESLSESFKEKKIRKDELEIQVDRINELEKAYILYNHIWFGNLAEEYIEEIFKEKRYHNIIKHKNFNPRLISFITDLDHFNLIDPSKYWNEIKTTLDNPKRVWENLFDNQIDQTSRNIVIIVSFNSKAISEENLKYSIDQLENNTSGVESIIGSGNFLKSLKHIVGALIDRSIEYKKNAYYDLYNPSIADFIINRYSKETDVLLKVFTSLKTSASLDALAQLHKNNKIDSKIYKLILSNILNKVKENGVGLYSENYIISLAYLLLFEKGLDLQIIIDLIKENNFSGYSIRDETKAIQVFSSILDVERGNCVVNVIKDFIRSVAEIISEDDYVSILNLSEEISNDFHEEILGLLKVTAVETWKNDLNQYLLDMEVFSHRDIEYSNYGEIEGISGGFERASEAIEEALSFLELNSNEMASIMNSFDESYFIGVYAGDGDYDDGDYYRGSSSGSVSNDYTNEIDDLFSK